VRYFQIAHSILAYFIEEKIWIINMLKHWKSNNSHQIISAVKLYSIC